MIKLNFLDLLITAALLLILVGSFIFNGFSIWSVFVFILLQILWHGAWLAVFFYDERRALRYKEQTMLPREE